MISLKYLLKTHKCYMGEREIRESRESLEIATEERFKEITESKRKDYVASKYYVLD